MDPVSIDFTELQHTTERTTKADIRKLFNYVKQINIDNVDTLSGVVGLIFERALMEPKFVELYANLCSRLAVELPGFGPFGDDYKKITFKRILINKCQEEFERGEREEEEEEANRTDEEGETKETEEGQEEKRVKARRRMLGNIRFIGELYKKRMLTERIMHECIKKLLVSNKENPNPDEEDIEALCELMSSIGEMIDHPKAKEYMDAYFDMMFQLSNNMALSSRVRFMLKDAIDLRKNKWQQRRKVEGAKTIEEVHRDDAQECLAQSSRPVPFSIDFTELQDTTETTTKADIRKLFDHVKQINIDNADTLSGMVGLIFERAIMEPTFVEMYANLCSRLAVELPGGVDDNEKITFRRLLMNKCQEEFERGEREEEEANRTEEDGGIKQTEEERVKARRRMLSNIRFIGELYKKRMLTERIMHECIKKLLGFIQNPNPDEQNIEALCKLMSAIGERIDHPKAKEHIDAYFKIMFQLSNNMALSSQARFMLKDAIDLRKNKWQQRRKVEGAKTIEEVHRDAAQERFGPI